MTTDTIKISCPIFMISNTHLAHVYEHRKKPSTLEVYYSGTNQEQNMVPFGLGWKLCLRLRSFFFFFYYFTRFAERQGTIIIVTVLFMGPTTTLFRKKILKMSPTILFTHLKIILLQYFSVFSFTSKQKKYKPKLVQNQIK